MKQDISVVVPAYNEEENITDAVGDIASYLRKKKYNYEIIVVNDGSIDSTGSIVESLMEKNHRIRLVNHSQNLGYGAALRSGFSKATKEMIFYTDADCQYDIRELGGLLRHIKKHDIVAGFRVNRQDPLMRIFVAFVYNAMIRFLLGLRVRDVDCSFKLYRRKIFERISLKSNTGLIDAEVLVKALKNGFTIAQVGVTHFPRRKGRTIYEVGRRNGIIAFVRPRVVMNIFEEIKFLWKELH